MQIYAAFNGDGVSVLVSESDLDAAARVDAPLSTELADAAAQARRSDLIEQLRASLDGERPRAKTRGGQGPSRAGRSRRR